MAEQAEPAPSKEAGAAEVFTFLGAAILACLLPSLAPLVEYDKKKSK